MLVGEYSHNIDEKGRMAVPFRMRHQFGDGAVITRGLDGCLNIYSQEEWAKVAEKVSSLPMSSAKARRFQRFMLGGATEVEFDKQGRVLIPVNLREHADLSANAMIVGVYTHAEIWNKDRFADQSKDISPEQDLEDLEI